MNKWAECFSLPMYAELTAEMIEHVCTTLTAALATQPARLPDHYNGRQQTSHLDRCR